MGCLAPGSRPQTRRPRRSGCIQVNRAEVQHLSSIVRPAETQGKTQPFGFPLKNHPCSILQCSPRIKESGEIEGTPRMELSFWLKSCHLGFLNCGISISRSAILHLRWLRGYFICKSLSIPWIGIPSSPTPRS
jgi:hypothetical protein